jgi:hypothetical protein
MADWRTRLPRIPLEAGFFQFLTKEIDVCFTWQNTNQCTTAKSHNDIVAYPLGRWQWKKLPLWFCQTTWLYPIGCKQKVLSSSYLSSWMEKKTKQESRSFYALPEALQTLYWNAGMQSERKYSQWVLQINIIYLTSLWFLALLAWTFLW